MPLHFEKFVRAGPFRFDALQRGKGLAVASKYAGPIGCPRAHLIRAGRSGWQYQNAIKTVNQPRARAADEGKKPQSIWLSNVEMVQVDSGDVLQMRDEAFGAILDDINAQARVISAAVILPTGMVMLALIAGLVLRIELFALIALSLPLWLAGKWLDTYRRITVLFYEIDTRAKDAYRHFVDAFDALMSCSGKWHIEAGGAVTDVVTWKQNAGAAHLVQRSPTDLTYKLPYAIKSNITPPALRVGAQTIYFFPDVALIQDGLTFGAVGYADLQLTWQVSNSIVPDDVPDDARIIGYAWQHPNKDGTPDRRYRENRQLPICAYEAMHISSPQGVNELVEFSRLGVVQGFVAAVASLSGQYLPIVNPRDYWLGPQSGF